MVNRISDKIDYDFKSEVENIHMTHIPSRKGRYTYRKRQIYTDI